MSITVPDAGGNTAITYTFIEDGLDIILKSMTYNYDAYNFNAQHTVATLPLNITVIDEFFANGDDIGNSNFQYISELVIGPNVKKFKKNLFQNWTRLTTLTINIIEWSNISFELETVTVYPDPWGDPEYSEQAPNPLSFNGCNNLVNLHIHLNSYEYTVRAPNTPTLFDGFFKNWLRKIKNIYYLSGKTDIYIFGTSAVNDDTEVTANDYFSVTSVTIPQSVTTINAGGLKYLKKLKTINFLEHSALKEIREEAFGENPDLTNMSLPSSLEIIGVNAFKGTKITSLIIPKSIKEIRTCAFRDCSNLTTVIFSSLNFNLGSIAGNYIFLNCRALTNIKFPNI
jgi:hypothetical protein